MLNIVKNYNNKPITEVHIVNNVHPKLTLKFFTNLLHQIKTHKPNLHIKNFTPIELDYMFRKAKKTIKKNMRYLHKTKLDSLPNNDTEIFNPKIKNQIYTNKIDTKN